MARRQSFSDKFWQDKHGNLVIWQRPNIPLIVWLAAFILSIILPDGPIERGVSFIAEAAIVIWAFMELVWGSSYFRRLLGICVLLLIATSYI
jgi:hypothetical protein